MKIIEQSWECLQKPVLPLETIENAGRTCYQSGDKITPESAENFVRMLINHGHMSVIEHVSASVRIITNRGVTHELVRHRLASFSQESTRYVRYDGNMEFIKPVWTSWRIAPGKYERMRMDECVSWSVDGKYSGVKINSDEDEFLEACYDAEEHYLSLLKKGQRPEQAREVLPNSLKTEIVMTSNAREWRHIFELRCSKQAHPQMRALMTDIREGFRAEIPVIFD